MVTFSLIFNFPVSAPFPSVCCWQRDQKLAKKINKIKVDLKTFLIWATKEESPPVNGHALLPVPRGISKPWL